MKHIIRRETLNKTVERSTCRTCHFGHTMNGVTACFHLREFMDPGCLCIMWVADDDHALFRCEMCGEIFVRSLHTKVPMYCSEQCKNNAFRTHRRGDDDG